MDSSLKFRVIDRWERTGRLRMPKAVPLQTVLVLLALGCSSLEAAWFANSNSVATQVAWIRDQVKHIADLTGTPPSADLRQFTKELPHWQFSGFFENATPVLLRAQFSEGQAVRQETYYFHGGSLILVKTETWWDVEDENKAPEPPRREAFYVQNNRTIRHVTEVGISSAARRPNDTAHPAGSLVERSRRIAGILVGAAADPGIAASLKDFPKMPR
ncbi:MAG TPA: hypothetical protein VMI94_25940 [Bryobacteraceae bacterium]|nr:hypothetical protein [Bryobacteraceae bacterium]